MQSLAERFRAIPLEERLGIINSLTPEQALGYVYDWGIQGRPEQQMPRGDWFVWLILAGRGWGKTRTATENIARMLRGPSPHVAPPGAPRVMTIVADTPFDMRQYCVEGQSGFLHVGPRAWRPQYSPANKTLVWPCGTRALLFSAEDPETLRGASGEFFWWDELAKSRYASAGWSNMMFGMREGNPRGIVTTTPRPIPLIRQLLARPSTVRTVGSTWENKSNLAEIYYREVIAPLEGTRLGRQEIHAEILEDVPNALWDREMFDQHRRRRDQLPELVRVVVAVDPSGTRGEEDSGDQIGIVAAGLGSDGRGYVLEDRSCKLSPGRWARRAVSLYEDEEADMIVAEPNYGGAMVEHTIRTVAPMVPYRDVHATRGKVVRAQPVAALYEQGKISHVTSPERLVGNTLSQLEDQCCQMTTDGYVGTGSPDRVDALVWAITELMLAPQEARGAVSTFQMHR